LERDLPRSGNTAAGITAVAVMNWTRSKKE
jgi:hypothetical protein